ncbi:hypothetical protein D3C86_1642260 [compost metagenome]
MGSAIGVADGAASAPVSWAAGDSTRPSKRRKRASSAGRAVSGHCAVRSRISASADSVRSSASPVSPCTRSSRSVNVALASHSSAALRLSARAGSSCVPKRSTSADSSSKPDAMPSAPSRRMRA